jgi:beta-lactamase regulating signal transducer with metallopeptidase domain
MTNNRNSSSDIEPEFDFRFLRGHSMNALQNLLFCGLLQVTLVAAVGLIVVAISGRWSRFTAASFSFLTLTAIFALTVLAFVPWSGWLADSAAHSAASKSSGLTTATDNSGTVEGAVALDDAQPFGIAEFVSAGIEGIRNLNQTTLPSASSDIRVTGTEAVKGYGWMHWLSATFAVGVLLGLVRLLGGIVGVRLMVRSSRPLRNQRLREMIETVSAEMRCHVQIEARESKRLATAATVGWRRPVILISDTWKSWKPNQLRSVLAHEIAHIVRGDFASTVAAQLGTVLHFYHPLVHCLVNRLRLEQELVADTLAARVSGGSQAYLRAIGELALMQSKEQLSWPAQSFLPTRRTFLRRIEMLRDMKLLADRAPLALRVVSLASVVAATLAVAGIRPPGPTTGSPLEAAQPLPFTAAPVEPAASQQSAKLDAQYVPANILSVAVFRPSELLPFYRQARAKVEGAMSETEKAGLDAMARCNLVTVVMSNPGKSENRNREPFGMVLSFSDRAARDAVAAMLTADRSFRNEKLLLAEVEVDGAIARYLPDETTLIFGETNTVKSMVLAGPSSLSLLTQTDAWTEATRGTIAVAIDPAGLKTIMAEAPPNPIIGMFSSLWMQADNHTLGIKLGDAAELKLVSSSPDEKSAKVVEATLNAGMTMASGMVMNQKATVPAEHRSAVESFETFLNSKVLVREGNQITLSLKGDAADQVNAIVGLLIPAVSSSRQAAQRAMQTNNLKQIMLAMHNYHDINQHFPPAVIVDAKSGVKRSWRIELLPYLNVEPANLYEQYRKDQPWDSEANKAVLAQMPSVFRHPSMPQGATNSSIFAVVGKGLVFENDNHNGTKMQEITDGTSNTVALVEARRDVPWTKPEDIEFDLSSPKLPELGFIPEGFIVGVCDGSVRFISKSIDVTTWNKLLTRSGGEVIPQF